MLEAVADSACEVIEVVDHDTSHEVRIADHEPGSQAIEDAVHPSVRVLSLSNNTHPRLVPVVAYVAQERPRLWSWDATTRKERVDTTLVLECNCQRKNKDHDKNAC